MNTNQMALHTTPGCIHTTPPNQIGVTVSAELDCSQPPGCVVQETQANSYGDGFNAAGGGVFAAQFDVTGSVFSNLQFLLMYVSDALCVAEGYCTCLISLRLFLISKLDVF